MEQGLATKIINDTNWSKSITLFKLNFKKLLKTTQPPSASTPWGIKMLLILNLRKEIVSGNFHSCDSIDENELFDMRIKLDFLTAVLINYKFKCCHKLNNVNVALFYKLLTFHRELGHIECISVLTNICMKLAIKNNFKTVFYHAVDIKHQGLYSFYTGYVDLVEGRYKNAVEALKYSSILRNSIYTEACLIVASLLINEHYNPRKYKNLLPYLELKLVVETGCLDGYKKVVDRHMERFNRDGLMKCIEKLLACVEKRNYYKISKIYSRMPLRKILQRGVNKEMVAVKDEVINFNKPLYQSYDIEGRINECKELESIIESLMRYKDVEPLCFEVIEKSMENK